MVTVSFYTGTQSEVIFANGFAYPTANANSTSAQSLIAGASGKYQQPVFYGGFFQQGRTGQVAAAEFAVILNTSGTPNVTFTAGVNTSSNNVSGSTLVATNKFATSSWSGGTVYGRLIISNFGSGYGTSSVSTNLYSTMSVIANNGSTTGGVVAAGGPTQLATTDFSVNQWLYLTVTFDSGSASNTAVLQQLIVYGLN